MKFLLQYLTNRKIWAIPASATRKKKKKKMCKKKFCQWKLIQILDTFREQTTKYIRGTLPILVATSAIYYMPTD